MRLNQVSILSQDVECAVVFYEALGLKRIAANYPSDARLLCPGEGSAVLAITHSKQMPIRSNATLYFECEDLDRTVARLRAQGVVFDSDPLDEPWHWREARLRDPDGNPIVLYTPDRTRAAEPRPDPAWRFLETDDVHA